MTTDTLGRALFALVLSLGLTGAAKAAPRLQLEEVELLGYAGDDLRVAIEIPCGGRLYGILTRMTAQKRLGIAAVVERDAIVCTTYPTPQVVTLDFLATSGVREIVAMKVDMMKSRIALAPVTAIEVLPKKDGVTPLKVAYEPRCGESLGTVVRVAGKAVEIAMAERPASTTARGCGTRSRVTTVGGLALKPDASVKPLRRVTERQSLARAHDLRLAPIRPGSIKRLGAFGLSVDYKRACNEAPVGLVMEGDAKAPRIGVLVARYHNFRCPQALARTTWANLTNHDVRVRRNAALSPIVAASDALTLVTPSAIARPSQKRGLSLRFVSPCEAPLGVVYAQDARGQVAVGLVASGASRCKSGAAEVSLTQPFVADHVQGRDLAPLKLQGRTAS